MMNVLHDKKQLHKIFKGQIVCPLHKYQFISDFTMIC